MAAVRPEGYRAMVAMLARSDVLAEAARITMPSLVIAGGADLVAPAASGRAVAARLGAPCVVIPGVGHYGCLEDPAAFDRVLGDFLDRVSVVERAP